MHKLTATAAILDHEITELRLLIERQTGIVLDCNNSALAAHVAKFVENEELDSSAVLIERLRSSDQDSAALSAFLDGLISSRTGFFRHQSALNALSRQVVPQLCARKSLDGPNPLRIWSAGCSTGEETYSIAMAVCDALSQAGTAPANLSFTSSGQNAAKSSRNGGVSDSGTAKPTAFSLHIVGSDLIKKNIEAADRGAYPQSALEGLPPATIRNYFSKMSSSQAAILADVEGAAAFEHEYGPTESRRSASALLLVKPRLRSLVTFNCMNLARPGYIGRFDVIFCMDVLPHFSRAQRIALIERLHLYLEPGGYLFLGQTEKLISSNLNFRSETFDGYTYHRKPLAASAAYGR